MRLNLSQLAIILLSSVVFSIAAAAQISFPQPPLYAGSGDVFVADFNGDAKLDILTSDGTMNLGNGDGTFKTGTAVSGTVLAVADFNGDGKPDVLEQSTGTLLVLLGKGDGTFQSSISTASGANLTFVAAADLNADGKAGRGWRVQWLASRVHQQRRWHFSGPEFLIPSGQRPL